MEKAGDFRIGPKHNLYDIYEEIKSKISKSETLWNENSRTKCENSLNLLSEAIKEFETSVLPQIKKEKKEKKEKIKYFIALGVLIAVLAGVGYYFHSPARNTEKYEQYLAQGKQYVEKGAKEDDYWQAINDFTKAIEINSKDARAYFNRGWAYFYLSEYQKAIDDCTRAIKINPQEAAAYSIRGIVWYDLHEYQKAIDDCTRAIKLNPEYVYAYKHRGDAYYKLGEDQKAIDDFYHAGIVFLKANNRYAALQCVDSIKKVDPSSPLIDKLQDLIDQI